MLCALLAMVALQDVKDVVIAGSQAYLLLAPEVVCAPHVENAQWAPFGRYILAQRTVTIATPEQLRKALAGEGAPPIPQSSLVLWSAISRRSKEIWRASPAEATIRETGWFAGTDVAFLTIRFSQGPAHSALYRIPGSTGRIEPLASTDGDMAFFPSPVRGIGLLRRGDARDLAGGEIWNVVRSNGSIGPTLKLQPYAFPTQWSADGKRVYWEGTRRKERPGEAVVPGGRPVVFQLDLDSNEFSEVAAPRDTVRERPTGDLRLEMARIGTGPDFGRQLKLRASEGESKPVVISGDVGRMAELSPTLDGVLFDTSQALFVRPLIKMDAAKFKEMVDAAERAKAISNAKQCALALLMYAVDYDDVLPPAGDVNSLLQPYVKNGSILEGFAYTFAGGPINGIANPAGTPIGSVPGPGGRAVAYPAAHGPSTPD